VTWRDDTCPTLTALSFIFIHAAGKENYPTLAYNVVVSHAKEIFHITPSKPGTANDKTLVRFDNFITGLSDNPVYSDFEYTLFDRDGGESTVKGAYVINDGGYHRWRTTIAGYTHSTDIWEAGSHTRSLF